MLLHAYRFIRENDVPTLLARLRERDTHPVLQFIKYVFCGAGAFAIHQAVWFALSVWMFPAIDSSIPQEVRAHHSMINNFIAGGLSTLFAYVTNVMWVFVPGRHHPFVEFLYFVGVSLIGLVGGMLAGPWLIHAFGIPTLLGQVLMAGVSMMINYICRKLFIFQG